MSHQISAKSVAICDTQPIAIEGIRALLNQCQEFHLAAAETSLLGGIEMVRQHHTVLVYLDTVAVWRSLVAHFAAVTVKIAP